MKKLLTLAFAALALAGCKTEIEKEISLNKILTQPLQAETALLNVEIMSCHNREDSRLESDDLIKIKSKIPSVFKEAKYKECYSKRANSFAVFEIPVAVGVVDDNTKVEEHDIAIYSYKNRPLNIRTTKEFSENVRNFLKSEFIPNFNFNVTLNVKNDTEQDHKFNLYSAYVNDMPVSVATVPFKKGEEFKIQLSNSSADALYRFSHDSVSVVLGEAIEIR